MDLLQRIETITDQNLKNLVTHSVRYALHHSLIASNAEEQMKGKTDSNDIAQTQQAVIMHKETHALMIALVEELTKTKEVPAPQPN